jgi:hypothetical protein
MFRTTSRTLLGASFALAVFCSWPLGASIGQTVCPAASLALTPTSASQVCPATSGTPPTVVAGTSATLTLCTNGTIDLGNVTTQQFGIRPSAFASNYKIIQQFATELIFSVDIASSAEEGRWTFFVNDASGHEVVALDVFINPAPTGGLCTNCLPGRGQCCGKPGQAHVCCNLETERCEEVIGKCISIQQPR